MKRTLLTLASICISLNIYSQAPGWLWAKGFGSTNNQSGYAITTDALGNVYSTGLFSGTIDFDPGVGVYNLTSLQGPAVYVIKLDALGNFIWAKAFTGNAGSGEGSAIVVDASGKVFISGLVYGTIDFDPGPGVYNLSAVSNSDVFISCLDASGNFLWAKAITNTDIDGNPPLLSMALDGATGSVYTAGHFFGTVDFDPDAGTFNISSNGDADVFILKLNAAGNFVWAKTIGGTAEDTPNGIALDPIGNVYCAGRFNGTADMDPGVNTFNLTPAGSTDIFITKLDNGGNFIWGKRIGGTAFDIIYSMTSDQYGNIYTTGDFGGTMDFDPGAGTYYISAVGSDDTFVAKMDSGGNLTWAKAYGGSGIAVSHVVAVDSNQNVYTTGYYAGTSDFDPGPATHNLTPLGSFDIFVVKQDTSGNLDWAKSVGGTGVDNNFAATFSSYLDGSVYITGDFYSPTCTFDSTILTNSGSSDLYIAKLGTCAANFSIYQDTVPSNWIGVNLAEGIPPLTYTWNWGDGTPNSTGPTPSHTYSTAGYFNICLTITDAVGCTSTYCDSSTYLYRVINTPGLVTVNFVFPGGSVGIKDPVLVDDLIFIAPNPTDNYFTISGLGETDDVSIVNSVGESQFIYRNNMKGMSLLQQQINIDATEWSAGIYFVRVVTQKGMVTKKVIVY